MVPQTREVEPTVLSAKFPHCYFLPLCSRYWMRRCSLSTAFRLITAVCKIPHLLSPTVCCPWWPWPSITQYCLMAIPVSMSTPCICKRTYLMLVTYFFTSSLLVGFSSSGIQASVSLQFEALSSGIQSPLHGGGTGGSIVRRYTKFLKCLLEEARVISCC